MSKVTVTDIREESATEAQLREWFQDQVPASLDTLDAAARTLEGLSTALLGTLFGVLTVASDPRPAYMALSLVRGLGVLVVLALLVALICALAVVYPRKLSVSFARPDQQAQTFNALLQEKSRWLTAALIAFGVGVSALSGVLVIAIL